MQNSNAPQQPAQSGQPAQPAAPFGIAAADLARLNEQLAQLSQVQANAQANAQASANADAAAQAVRGSESFRVLNVGSGPGGVPMNAAEMRALRTQREEMSNQLTNVADRREGLVNELAKTQGEVARRGLEARIAVLDKRIVDIEREMARTGELVMMAPASLQRITASSSSVPGVPTDGNWRPNDDAMIAISSVFTLAVLMPLAITAARIWWRRATGTIPARQAKAESDRFEKLEQAVDSIAIEMERVSEGQRFVTRILTEGRGESPVFGAANRGEALRVPAMGAQAGDPERR